MQVAVYAIPAAIIGVVVCTYPMCRLVLWEAESVVNSKEVTAPISLAPLTWSAATLARVEDVRPFVVFFIIRQFVGSPWAGMVAFSWSAFRAVPADECRLRCRLVLVTLAFYVLIAAGAASYHTTYLHGYFHLGMWTLWSFSFVRGSLIAIGASAIYVLIFCRGARCKAGLYFIAVQVVVLAVHWSWRFMCMNYFRMRNSVLRVALAIVSAPLFGAIAFETFVRFAGYLLQHRNFHGAVLLVMKPLMFSNCIGAAMQLGSVNLVSGVLCEIGACMVKLDWKHCLLSGETPFQRARRRVSKVFHGVSYVIREYLCPRRSQVHPDINANHLDPVFPPVSSSESSEKAVPDVNANHLDHVCSSSESSGKARSIEPPPAPPQPAADSQSLSRQRAEQSARQRRELLAAVALCSVIPELIVEVMSVGLMIFARLNPNESDQPPVPMSQLFALLAIKVLSELVSDIPVGIKVAAMRRTNSGRDIPAFDGSIVQEIGWILPVEICVMTVVWTLNMQSFFVQFFCPYANVSGESGTTGILGSDAVLSIGLCA